MSESYDWLIHNHSEFETSMYEFSDAVEQEAWDEAESAFAQLVEGLKAHMAMEEEVLYPAYEKRQELPQEPVLALRAEHDLIVRMVRDLARIIKVRDSEHTLAALLPLEQVLIAHHEKEEDIFLPMAGQFLLPDKDAIIRQLQAFDVSAAHRKWQL